MVYESCFLLEVLMDQFTRVYAL